MQSLDRNFRIFDESGEKTIPARTVFAHGIRYLKGHLKKVLKQRGMDELADHDKYIKYVLTVPAIWDDKAKQFMREAAKEVWNVKEDFCYFNIIDPPFHMFHMGIIFWKFSMLNFIVFKKDHCYKHLLMHAKLHRKTTPDLDERDNVSRSLHTKTYVCTTEARTTPVNKI